MKIIIRFLFLFFTSYTLAQNQTISLNSTTHNTSDQYCGYWFYDDGGSGANYSNNQDYWITLQGNAAPNTHVRISFANFDVKDDDTFIYTMDQIQAHLCLVNTTILTIRLTTATPWYRHRFQMPAVV